MGFGKLYSYPVRSAHATHAAAELDCHLAGRCESFHAILLRNTAADIAATG